MVGPPRPGGSPACGPSDSHKIYAKKRAAGCDLSAPDRSGTDFGASVVVAFDNDLNDFLAGPALQAMAIAVNPLGHDPDQTHRPTAHRTCWPLYHAGNGDCVECDHRSLTGIAATTGAEQRPVLRPACDCRARLWSYDVDAPNSVRDPRTHAKKGLTRTCSARTSPQEPDGARSPAYAHAPVI